MNEINILLLAYEKNDFNLPSIYLSVCAYVILDLISKFHLFDFSSCFIFKLFFIFKDIFNFELKI
jgi:hypothetical protein